MTNIPSFSYGPDGPVVPAETEILAGTQQDWVDAFGGNLNPNLETPQGQLITSQAAIVANMYAMLAYLSNMIDPAYSEYRYQDAIGRIYYLTRIQAQSTVVTATCTGLSGTVIPVGAQAKDQAGNIYLCTNGGTIPIGGSIDLSFACETTGPIACPSGYLDSIYQSIPGWDSILNASAGVDGRDVESRADFEYRRSQSVAANAQGSEPAVLAAVLAVDGVLDAYVISNGLATTSGASFTGTIAGTTLTMPSVTGTVEIGQMVVGVGVDDGIYITGGSGLSWTVNRSQTVGPVAMISAQGGVQLVEHSIYVAAYGGLAQDIGEAIWTKKSPGCNYNGSTLVTVEDTTPPYTAPYPTYDVYFQIPTPTPILFAISMQNNSGVTSDAATQVKNAVIAAFNGEDGGSRARIGSEIFHSRFYAGIAALGSWALVYDIFLGIAAADLSSILMRIDQVPTIDAADIAVTFS